MSNCAAIPLACRPDLLLSPLGNREPGRYAVKDLRTGDCYTLGGQEYFLLAQLDGKQTAPELCQAFQEHFGRGLSETELHEFVKMAQAHGFLQSVGRPEEAAFPVSPADAGVSAVIGCRYDEVPCKSKPFAQTHPENLATVATLFGMRPPPVDHCRVLELSCASGGNLLPLAVSLPRSHFVGIDLSLRQISDGRRIVEALGLSNVELLHRSILDVGAELGEFDYILCHGVYSWVPPVVQDKTLEVCARHLAPDGVAYVSYNTYPGWHLPGVARAMMRYHADRFAEPAVQVRQARALLEFLARSAAPETDVYNGALRKELDLLRGVDDYYLYHEYLAEVNTPFYFHEFNHRAQAFGLQYLGEAAFLDMLTEYLPPEVEKTLHLLAPDLVHAEQYMDFLRNRRFRQTLLCHKGVALDRSVDLEAAQRMYVASPFQPVSAHPDIVSGAVEEFRTPQGFPLSTGEPLVKAALLHLAEAWPRAEHFHALLTAACARLGSPPERSPAAHASLSRLLLGRLLKCAGPKALEFRISPARYVAAVRHRPLTTPLARLQAAEGAPVTNLLHQAVTLTALDRQVLRYLDGSRDRGQLLQALADCADQGLLTTLSSGAKVDRGRLEDLLDQSLWRLARHGLLVG